MKRKKKQTMEEWGNDIYQNAPKEKGNVVTFFSGLMLFAIGVYMIFQNTTVTTSFKLGRLIGFEPPFGVVLIPMILGVILLFAKENSILGWFLLVFGVLVILAGILMGLQISFRRTTLFVTIVMYGMIAAGMGLTLRGLYGNKR